MAGMATNRPPKMHKKSEGEWDSRVPERIARAAAPAKQMKNMPTLVLTGFPVTFKV
jgi:hypothetical protein